MKTKYFIAALIFMFIMGIPSLILSQVVNLNGGIRLVAQGNISLVVDQGGMKNDGVFIPGNSTVYFSGAATTAISGSQPISFYNLIFKGTGTKQNSGNASVISTVGVEGTTVLDADGTTNDKPFTILSSDTATGRVDILTTGNIIGNVTVERFINTGTGTGQHAKSWQFLATPTTGQTYFQAWQEGGLAPAGYGTWVTGTGTGFDAVTVSASLKFYDQLTGSWTGVTNTSNSLQNKLGYMLFVRGDRTVTTYNGVPNNTNMRSKGILFTPFNPPPSVPVGANQFQSFGNPYASRIEFNKVYLASTGINDVFYAWDPKLNGSWNLGGYQTISGVAGYIPSAGSSTTYYPAGVPSPFIESGQAVFVQGNGTGGNVNFNENCKLPGSRLANKGAGNYDSFPPGRQFLLSSLFTADGMIADGNIVAFENGLGNDVNKYDALKMLNAGENFGIARDEKLLAVEARETINSSDTIFYYCKNLRQQAYQLRFAPVNISTELTAFLVDRFNNSRTIISLTDSSFINFAIGSEAGSKASDRFILVFRPPVVVPVLFVNVAANRNNDRSNQVTWKITNEISIQEYVVERSENGSAFIAIGNAFPSANNGGNTSYSYRDGTPLDLINFYRIKAISRTGQVQYSNIVKVETVNISAGISVYPNPVYDKNIQVLFRNQQKGNYNLQLTNKLGQLIYENMVYVDQTYMVQVIKPANMIASGTYQLTIIKADGSKIIEQVVLR
ncbi:MAG: T9SS type A sorting domain-containing protein [Ferruginibacter sp.]